MTPEGYRTTISAIGLSQVKAAKALGINERTSRRYASGDLVVPPKIQLALEALKARKEMSQ